MKKLVLAAVAAGGITSVSPVHAQVFIPEDCIELDQCVINVRPRESGGSGNTSLFLLVMAGVVIASGMAGMATRDSHDLSIAPLDADADAGFKANE